MTWVDKSSPLLKLQPKALSRMILAVLSIQISGPLLASIGQSRAVALARYTDLCRKKCPKHNNHILGSQKSKRSTNCKKLLLSFIHLTNKWQKTITQSQGSFPTNNIAVETETIDIFFLDALCKVQCSSFHTWLEGRFLQGDCLIWLICIPFAAFPLIFPERALSTWRLKSDALSLPFL